MPSKIVIDTNIWVSFFIGKRFDEISDLISDFNIEVFTCDELIMELEDVLSRNKLNKRLNSVINSFYNLIKLPLTLVNGNKFWQLQALAKDYN